MAEDKKKSVIHKSKKTFGNTIPKPKNNLKKMRNDLIP